MPRRGHHDPSCSTSNSSRNLLLPLHLLVVAEPVPRHRDGLDAEPPDLPVGARRRRVGRTRRTEGHEAVVFPPSSDPVFREVDVEDLPPLAEVGADHRLGDCRGHAADVDPGAGSAREASRESCCCRRGGGSSSVEVAGRGAAVDAPRAVGGSGGDVATKGLLHLMMMMMCQRRHVRRRHARAGGLQVRGLGPVRARAARSCCRRRLICPRRSGGRRSSGSGGSSTGRAAAGPVERQRQAVRAQRCRRGRSTGRAGCSCGCGCCGSGSGRCCGSA